MDDQTFENQLKKIRDLERQTEVLEKQAEELMKELGLTREDLDMFFSDPSKFSEQELTFIQEHKKQFEYQFQQHTERLRTVDGLKKKYQDLHLSRHWIPVR